MSASDQERTGGCLCGGVRYRMKEEPLITAICHCRHCQRQSGSAFSVVCAVPDSGFEQDGETQVYIDRGDSGQAVQRHFCPNCGSPVVSIVEALPGLTIVKAGTLDDPSSIVPTQEAYCRDAWTIVPRLQGTQCFHTSNIGGAA